MSMCEIMCTERNEEHQEAAFCLSETKEPGVKRDENSFMIKGGEIPPIK